MDSVPEFFVMLPFVVVELPDVEGIADYLVDRAFGEGLASAGLVALGVELVSQGLERVMSAAYSRNRDNRAGMVLSSGTM